VIPVFIWAPEEEGAWPPGAASRWWLHRSLARLDASLQERGSRLVIRRGPSLETIRGLASETGAQALFQGRRYEPAAVARDTALKTALEASRLEYASRNTSLLAEPWEFATGSGGPFRLFTPFHRAFSRRYAAPPHLPAPGKIPAPHRWPKGLPLDALGLAPRIPWDAGLREAWTPGEPGAVSAMRRFARERIERYSSSRDLPGDDGVSRLSPHLHFGEISPHALWAAAESAAVARAAPGAAASAEAWQRQLVWREFAHHLLFHFPHTADAPLREEFARFPWRDPREPGAASELRAWKQGRTGYPVVDAAMRELWTTGWMHNRARMIAASFLVKDLLLPWQAGARWFWDTLVDADLANNTLGWQWTAGCGADAAPYFRIFNPSLQSRKFDPRGRYLRRWIPELAGLSGTAIHAPWEAQPESGPGGYPAPIVDHAEARAAALAAHASLRLR